MSEILLLRGARVQAPEALGAVDVLVAGGRVAAIGANLALPPAAYGAEVVAVDGLTIAPGLVDLHTHLCGGGGEGGAHTRVPPLAPTALTMAGVTTAIGLLGTDGTTRSLAELLAAARGLSHFGLHALCYTGSYEVPPPTLTGSVRGDLVHVDRMVAVGEVAISDHRSSQPTFDELVRLAADAHVAGMMTGKAGLLHLHLGDGPRGLELVRRALRETELPPRAFHPTHCNRNPSLWAESLDLGAAGGFVDLTAGADDGAGVSAAQAVLDWVARGLPLSRLTFSSDAGGCLPCFDGDGVLLHMDVGHSGALLDTVRALVAAGLDLGQALAPCTASAGDHFRLGGRGRLRVGGPADLLILDAELKVWGLLGQGRWLVRGGEPVVRGMFERGPALVEGAATR